MNARARLSLLSLSALTILSTAACATTESEDQDDEKVGGGEAAATATTTETTTIVTDDNSRSAGLTMTFTFETAHAAGGQLLPTLTLKRGTKSARLSCSEMTGNASAGSADYYAFTICDDTSQPGFALGSNHCEMSVNIFTAPGSIANRHAPYVKFSCRNPGPLSSHQLKLLELVHGNASAYERVGDRTSSISRGELAATELPSTVRVLGTTPEKDPIALTKLALDAALPVLGKSASLTFTEPPTTPQATGRTAAIALLTVFIDAKQMRAPLTARTADGKVVHSKEASLRADARDPASAALTIVGKAQLTERLAASIDAR